MARVVAQHQILLRHPQWDPQHIFDEGHDQRRPHHVPADDEHGARDLIPDLDAVALDGAAGVRDAECRTAGDGGEDTSGTTADHAGDEMGVENTEDVIH